MFRELSAKNPYFSWYRLGQSDIYIPNSTDEIEARKEIQQKTRKGLRQGMIIRTHNPEYLELGVIVRNQPDQCEVLIVNTQEHKTFHRGSRQFELLGYSDEIIEYLKSPGHKDENILTLLNKYLNAADITLPKAEELWQKARDREISEFTLKAFQEFVSEGSPYLQQRFSLTIKIALLKLAYDNKEFFRMKSGFIDVNDIADAKKPISCALGYGIYDSSGKVKKEIAGSVEPKIKLAFNEGRLVQDLTNKDIYNLRDASNIPENQKVFLYYTGRDCFILYYVYNIPGIGYKIIRTTQLRNFLVNNSFINARADADNFETGNL